MGLNYTILDINSFLTESSVNNEIIKRNSEVLPSTYTLCDMFSQISDELRFKGIIRFEYKNWEEDEIRRIEGYVCKVELTNHAVDVKLWTLNHEMVLLTFSVINQVQFYGVPEQNVE